MVQHVRMLTVAFKLQVIEYAEKHGNWAAGHKYDIDEKRLRYWLQQEQAPHRYQQELINSKKYRHPGPKDELVKYVIDTRRDSYTMSTYIHMKVLNISCHMGIPQAQSKAIQGWATRLMK